MSIKKQYAANTAFHWDGRDGNLIDKSGNVADGSFVNSPEWQMTGRGRTLFLDGATTNAKYISFPTGEIGDAVNGASAITIGCWFNPNGASGDGLPSLLHSWISTVGAGMNLRVDSITASTFKLLLGGRSVSGDSFQSHTTTATYSLNEEHFFIGVLDFANDTVSIDVDGAPEGSTSVSFTNSVYTKISTASVDTIGVKNSTGTLSLEYGGNVREMIIFNTGLTSTERTQFYEESLKEKAVISLSKCNFQLSQPSDSVPESLVGAWNPGQRVGNTVADLSDRNNSGAVVSNLISEPGLWGNAGNFINADQAYLYMGDVLDDVFAGADKQFTISTWIEPSSVMTNNFFISKYYTGTNEREFIWRISTDSKLEFFWSQSLAGATHRGVLGSTPITNLNTRYHIVIEYDGTLDTNDGLDRVRMWVNDVEETNTLSLTAGALGAMIDGGASFTIGWAADGDGTPQGGVGSFDGPIDRVRVWTGLQGDTVASEEYARGRDKLIYKNDFSDEPVSVAAVSSGFISDWRVDSGSYKITDDGTQKWLECVSAGMVYIDSLKAFGTWQFDLYKKETTGAYVMLLADVIGSNVVTGQDGYYFALGSLENIALGKSTNGSGAVLSNSSNSYIAADTKYSFRITRSATGVFTSYIKGGAFTAWTLIDSSASGSNPSTDLTHTGSKYFIPVLGIGEKISNIKFWEGVISPL